MRTLYQEHLKAEEEKWQESLRLHRQVYDTQKIEHDKIRSAILEDMDDLTNSKEQFCTEAENPVGHLEPIHPRSRILRNFSQKVGVLRGSRQMNWIYGNIFDPTKVTRASCEEVDCLHPCYGASHEAYCGKCW